MTEDVDKAFFDVIVQLKEIDSEAYYKILEELGYDSVYDKKQHFFWQKDLKRTLIIKKKLIEKTNLVDKGSSKKISRSLNDLLKVEKDLKKMNADLKKVIKKVKTLEKENLKLSKKLDKK